MALAARSVGWGALLVAAAGATVVALAIVRGTSSRAATTRSHDDAFRRFTFAGEGDEIAAQSCFDRYSGLVAIERNADERAIALFAEGDGPLARCLENHGVGSARRPSATPEPPPVALYDHRSHRDPWAPRSEPLLFPPKGYDCAASVSPRFIPATQIDTVRREALECMSAGNIERVQVRLAKDGRVNEVFVDSMPLPAVPKTAATSARLECVARTFCQYRFEPAPAQLELSLMRMR